MKSGKFFEYIIALSLILVVIVVTYKLFIKDNSKLDNSTPASKVASELVEKQRNKAVSKGIEWLIKNKDSVKPSDAVVTLLNLYKTTNDPKISEELSVIIKEKSAKIEIIDTDFDTKNKKYLDWNNLKEVYYSLQRKKCKNQEYKKDLEKFEKYLSENKDKIFSDKTNLHSKLIVSYQLKNMEIYFDNYLDASLYPLEATEAKKALNNFSSENFDDQSVDITSELLTSLKILKIAPSESTTLLYKKLMSIQ